MNISQRNQRHLPKNQNYIAEHFLIFLIFLPKTICIISPTLTKCTKPSTGDKSLCGITWYLDHNNSLKPSHYSSRRLNTRGGLIASPYDAISYYILSSYILSMALLYHLLSNSSFTSP